MSYFHNANVDLVCSTWTCALKSPLSALPTSIWPSEIQDHIYCGHSIKAEAKVRLNSIKSVHHQSSLTSPVITDNTDHYQHCWSNSDLHSGTTLTVYLNSYSIDTMTCSTLTSFHTSRQPTRQTTQWTTHLHKTLTSLRTFTIPSPWKYHQSWWSYQPHATWTPTR